MPTYNTIYHPLTLLRITIFLLIKQFHGAPLSSLPTQEHSKQTTVEQMHCSTVVGVLNLSGVMILKLMLLSCYKASRLTIYMYKDVNRFQWGRSFSVFLNLSSVAYVVEVIAIVVQ